MFWAECAISMGNQRLCQSCPHPLTHLGLRSSSRAAAGGGWTLNQGNLCQRVPLFPAAWGSRVCCAWKPHSTGSGSRAEPAKTRITSTGKHSWEAVDRDEQPCGYHKRRGVLHSFSLGLPILDPKSTFHVLGSKYLGCFLLVCHRPTKNYSATLFRVDGSGIKDCTLHLIPLSLN